MSEPRGRTFGQPQPAPAHDAGDGRSGWPPDRAPPALSGGSEDARHAAAETARTPPRPGAAAGPRPGLIEAVAALATLLWLGAAAALWQAGTHAAAGGAGAAAFAFGATVPVVLIWLAALSARSLRALRAESAELRAAIAALHRQALGRHPDVAGRDAPAPAAATMSTAPHPASPASARNGATDLERRLDQMMAAQRRIEAALGRGAATGAAPERKAALPPSRPAAAIPAAAEPQPLLDLGAPAQAQSAPVTVADFLSALNFPDSPEDAEGFRALRRALQDPRAARLIRAAQDVLTLLSEDGIYMDDLVPDPTGPEPWRRFARGERGEAVAALGAIDAPDSLARAAARLREDAVFRDVAHHFLRHFDRMLEAFEPGARDDDLLRLADTRSGRAFMLLGRVTGIFG